MAAVPENPPGRRRKSWGEIFLGGGTRSPSPPRPHSAASSSRHSEGDGDVGDMMDGAAAADAPKLVLSSSAPSSSSTRGPGVSWGEK